MSLFADLPQSAWLSRRVAWGNPVTRGLEGTLDPASQMMLTPRGAVRPFYSNVSSFEPAIDSIGARFVNGSGHTLGFDIGATLSASEACTVEVLLVSDGAFPSLASVVALSNEQRTDGQVAVGSGHDGAIRGILSFTGGLPADVYLWGGAQDFDTNVPFPGAGFVRHLFFVKTAGTGAVTLRLYSDGVQVAAGASSNVAPWVTSGPFFYIGGRQQSAAVGACMSARVVGASVWRRELSPDEVRSLRANRGQLFEPRRIWVPVAVGGGVSGTSATTNANDTSSASGSPIIVGTSATTNAADTSTASGTPIIVGTSATTNANDTSSASGTVGGGVVGTSATTNANDTASASGSPIVNGTSTTTNAADTASAAGWAGVVSGTVAATNRNDTAAAEGFIGAEAPRRNTGAGKSKRRRYTVEVDGEEYEVASPAEAEEVLAKVREQAEQTAAVALDRAKAAEKRLTRKVLADARKALTLPEIKVPDEMQARVQETLEGIESLYQSTLQTIEIAALLRKRQQEEEDDEDILLLIA